MSTLAKKYPGAALITGASAGLGECYARHCASEGMDVVLVARRLDRLEALAKDLESKYKIKAHAVSADLCDIGAVAQIKQACESAGISVSMLINNAGFGSHGYFHDTEAKWHEQMVQCNCVAPVALTNTFLPGMVDRKNGAIIFLASTAAYQPCPFFAVYGATKTFNLMLGEALWAELRNFGIDVIAVSPGYTATEFQDVANIKSDMPENMMRQPIDVVRTTFDALGAEPSVIDGFKNYMGAFMQRIMPRKTIAATTARLLKPTRN